MYMYVETHFLEEIPHLTDDTPLLHGVQEAAVTVREKVVTQDGRVRESLHDAVHETRVTEVIQSSKS